MRSVYPNSRHALKPFAGAIALSVLASLGAIAIAYVVTVATGIMMMGDAVSVLR